MTEYNPVDVIENLLEQIKGLSMKVALLEVELLEARKSTASTPPHTSPYPRMEDRIG